MSKVVAITGGFGVLGSAVGALLRENGWRIALLDRAEAAPAGAQFADLCLGGVDIGDPQQAEQAFVRIKQGLGRLDALVNVAGGFAWETVEGGSLDTWDRLYQMNVRTAVAASKAALSHLPLAGGRVVNVAAGAAVKAAAGMGAYAASKAGVMRFTEALAEEVKDRGITVNAIMPSIIDTPQNRKDMPDADFTRWVAPRSLAEVIQFLLSEGASAVNGASIPVQGRV